MPPTRRLHGELATVWPELAADGDARAIVITGAGPGLLRWR